MHRHFRRYCFRLAEKLKMSVNQVLTTMDSTEITEWMAYDLTCSEEWLKAYEKEKELEASREMSDEQRLDTLKQMLGGK